MGIDKYDELDIERIRSKGKSTLQSEVNMIFSLISGANSLLRTPASLTANFKHSEMYLK